MLRPSLTDEEAQLIVDALDMLAEAKRKERCTSRPDAATMVRLLGREDDARDLRDKLLKLSQKPARGVHRTNDPREA